MINCVNENCKKDPTRSMSRIVVNIDGDMACDKKCQHEYEKQKDEFFANISDDKWYQNWLGFSVAPANL